MFDTYKMQEHICTELERKAEAGIKNTTDLDTVWKLTDVYKNLLKIDMLEEASEAGENHYDGYSERRGQKRDRMGRYSRSDGGYSERDGENGTGNYSRNSYNYSERGYSRDDGEDPHDRYMSAKHSYASTKAPEHKKEMLDALKVEMNEFQDKIREVMRNADCRDERDVVKMFVDGVNKII